MKRHLLCNPSFRCQLSCPYCLIPHIKVKWYPEHSWAEWAVALRDHTEPDDLCDFAGGDPLLFPGLADLLGALAGWGRSWAITTNAIDTAGVDALMRVRPGNCALVNVSDHPGNYDASANVARLQSAFPVVFNRVDHPKAGRKHERIASFIPYQRWREGTELDGIRRWCNSGANHFVIDPTGDAFRCNPDMARGFPPIGNIFRRTVKTPEPMICESGCSTCYTAQPGAWLVEMRAV